MKQRKWGMIAALSVLPIAGLSVYGIRSVFADAITNPTELGSPGYISSTTDGIVDSTKLILSYPSGISSDAPGIPPEGPYTYDQEPIVITHPDGSTTKGWIDGYDYNNQTYLNGYNLIAWSDLSDWVNELGGNLTFVQRELANQQITLTDPNTGQSINMVNFASVVMTCGAIFQPFEPTVTVSGDQKITTYHVTATSAPTANSITITGPNIQG
ncbi:hypothetical protein AAC03nite_38270 [Alicyclobacillus acidoterrestris]|nr:hypothetical protein AAC03nite_38270 [Alicyclobacillus acidoterrestris]